MSQGLVISPALAKRVGEAREDVAAAEREVEAALKGLDQGDRSDKRIIGVALKAAFTRLTAARTKLDGVLKEAKLVD